MKSECPNPRVEREFGGTCNLCGETGHRKRFVDPRFFHSNNTLGIQLICIKVIAPLAHQRSVSTAISRVSYISLDIFGGEKANSASGHAIIACENPRKNIWPGVPLVPAEESWNELVEAAKDRELVDAKLAAQKYMKALPDITYVQLEEAFRSLNIPVFLIAIEKETQPTEVLMDPQGNLKKTYCVTWQFSDKPGRGKNREIWPESPAVNIERLADAGHVVDCLMPKCSNCDELGHTKKHCPQDVVENADRATVTCFNCGETGHRQRDCELHSLPPMTSLILS